MVNAKLLVVEDESIVARDIQNRLRNLGYDVPAIVAYGDRAVDMAADLRPDLVLMDIFLKGDMDGIKAAELIRARYDIPVIFLTAFADPGRCSAPRSPSRSATFSSLSRSGSCSRPSRWPSTSTRWKRRSRTAGAGSRPRSRASTTPSSRRTRRAGSSS